MKALAALVLCAGEAFAEGPPPEYFTGVYERVGRDGATPPGLLNDLVRMDPVEGGLAVTVCGARSANKPLMLLDFDSFGEVQNLLVSRGGDSVDVWCLYGNNGDNYPLLTCSGAGPGGTMFLLWPKPEAVCAP